MSVDTWSSSNLRNICPPRRDPPCWHHQGHRNRSLCSGNQSMSRGPNSSITMRWPWEILLSRWCTHEEQSSLHPGRAVPSSHSNWMTRWFAWGPFWGRQNVRADLSDLLVAPNVEASERLHQDLWHLCSIQNSPSLPVWTASTSPTTGSVVVIHFYGLHHRLATLWGTWLHLGSRGPIYQNGAFYTMFQSHLRLRDNESNLSECCAPPWVAWWHRLRSWCPIIFPFLEMCLSYSQHHHQVIDGIPSTNWRADGITPFNHPLAPPHSLPTLVSNLVSTYPFPLVRWTPRLKSGCVV